MRPRIGIIPGDPSGIGPELVARLLNDECRSQAEVLLIGDRHLFEQGQTQAGVFHELTDVDAGEVDAASVPGLPIHVLETIAPEDVAIGRSTRASGHATLRTLDRALELAVAGRIDAIVFGPFNKAAMHLAGIGHSDELHYMAEFLGVTGYFSELNTLDGMWTGRVTSHIALKDVAGCIDGQRIKRATGLIDRTLRRAGYSRPRIAVAALNPHAGDGGNFGREEIDVIGPAVREMAESQMAVGGPWPSDTVFLKFMRGEVDAVLTMYHDQGQIALKLMGFNRGVTVQGGLPIPVTTPAHGTAFDIAGSGCADVGAMRAAFELACQMVRNWEREVDS